MVSEDALIQQGIRYSDNLFKIIEERVLKALEQSSSLEEFLERTKDFTLENPMVSTGYQDTMTNLITSITNNVRFERAAQRELVRTAISSRVGELIQNVGDDLKESIRETVKQGYDEGLHSRDIAKRMSQNIQSINSRRARTIARTEVARAYVISDYIVNKERGATGFTVVCRPDCCPICAEDYAGRKNHVPDVDGDGRLIGGNVGFLIDDVGMLPPRHPNCRCSVNYFRGDGDEVRSKISRKKPTSTATTTTASTTVEGQVEEVIEEPQSVNPRIAELEKQISEQQKIADKWRKRGNESLAKNFESTISKLEKELKQLKNPNKPNNSSIEIQNKDLIDDVLTQVLNDIGLGDKAPKTKSESISKNIQTTHESNLWENLAKKHDLELIEASNSFVKYYDKEFDTRIEFNINSNKDWIDYTNSNKKDRNMEEFLKYYKEAPSNYKKASPPIKIIGPAPYDGVCELNTSDIHHIKIARSGYCEMKMQLGSGNLQQTMYHEMSHAFDQRHALDRVRAVMSRGNWWSSQKGGIYKKSTTKDRRNRKKTGGKQFVSEYARTGSSGGNLTEDMAELGSIVAMRDLKDKSNAYLYEYNEQGEYVKVYYDELKKRYPNKWNALEHEIFEGDIVW